jgi:hypothetical protein
MHVARRSWLIIIKFESGMLQFGAPLIIGREPFRRKRDVLAVLIGAGVLWWIGPDVSTIK